MDQDVHGLGDMEDMDVDDDEVDGESAEVEFHTLYESDGVPGAVLNTSSLCMYTNKQLKRWLQCRGLGVSGNKSQLEQRIVDHVNMGQSHILSPNVDGGVWLRKKAAVRNVVNPVYQQNDVTVPILPGPGCWRVFPTQNIPAQFNSGHIFYYLVESLPKIEVLGSEISKYIDEDEGHGRGSDKIGRIAAKLLKSRFVGCAMDSMLHGFYFVKAFVRATMEKTEYFVAVTISDVSGCIVAAQCECRAHALERCSHIAAVLFYVSDYAEKHGHVDVACTSKPREWGRGTVERHPGETVQQKYYDPLKWNVVRRFTFDPRPSRFQDNSQLSEDQIATFTQDLEAACTPDCGFLKALPKFYADAEVTYERMELLVDEVNQFYDELQDLLKPDTQPFLVPGTELQHLSKKWMDLHEILFTASSAKEIKQLASPEAKMSFLRRKLYESVPVTAAMQYGIDNEPKAREKYLKGIREADPDVRVDPGALWVDMDYPFLGCSPDNVVIPSGDPPVYIAEYKCLKVVENIHPKLFRKHLDKDQVARFPLKKVEGEFILKDTHSHYYQVQMQLGITRAPYCDYVVWSRKGIVVVRVNFNEEFWCSLKKVLINRHRNLFVPEYILRRAYRDLLPFELDLVEETVLEGGDESQ